jgi:hypothetical protein
VVPGCCRDLIHDSVIANIVKQRQWGWGRARKDVGGKGYPSRVAASLAVVEWRLVERGSVTLLP